MVMAMTFFQKWRKAMNRKHLSDDLIDLGRASAETRGGPMGYEDQERTFWLHGTGLSDD